jgi:hypothetical protein
MIRERGSEVTFALKLDSDELDVHTIAQTLSDIENLLADIEVHVRGQVQSSVRWYWSAESELEVVASVNGASREQLERIVGEAREGFERAERAARENERVQWPETFGTQARRSTHNILKRLEHLQSITIRAEKKDPLVIEAAEIGKRVFAQRKPRARQRVRASVEGRLELISHRGILRAAIKEFDTNAVIQCTFPDAMLEKIKTMFDRRVVAEGLVSYRENGTPISITGVTRLIERKSGRPLEDFIGAAPDLTGGLTTDEFMSKIRGYDDN